MTLQQKFNEYIASGDISISDEQRDWILPFIERCVGEEVGEMVGNIRLLIAKYAKEEELDVAGLVNEINTLCK